MMSDSQLEELLVSLDARGIHSRDDLVFWERGLTRDRTGPFSHHMLFPAFVLMLTRANGDLEVTRRELMHMDRREVQVIEPDADRVIYRLLPQEPPDA
jgi:hypothetical protein